MHLSFDVQYTYVGSVNCCFLLHIIFSLCYIGRTCTTREHTTKISASSQPRPRCNFSIRALHHETLAEIAELNTCRSLSISNLIINNTTQKTDNLTNTGKQQIIISVSSSLPQAVSFSISPHALSSQAANISR